MIMRAPGWRRIAARPVSHSRWRPPLDARWIALVVLTVCVGLVMGGCNNGRTPSESASPGAQPTSEDAAGVGSSATTSALAPNEPRGPGAEITADQEPVEGGHIANPMIPQEPSPFRFTNITEETGIDFVQYSGMTEEKHYPSANGSGVAIFDANGDGLMDLYFTTCTRLPLGTEEHGPNRLYLNNGDGAYTDATESSGLGFRGFCHGVITGDFDNDGDPDVFLACYGPNRMYTNNGDGTFTDVSAKAGIENMDRTVIDEETLEDGTVKRTERDLINWASGGATLDYNNDGWLDIYVAIHGDWYLPNDDKWCGYPDKDIRLYCAPGQVRTAKDILFRNNGDGTFTDVTDEAGLGRDDGHGFGVVAIDVNEDDLIDIYVANDQCPNFLFLNNGDGTFSDTTETSGAAFDIDGSAQSGMGVDAADVDGDNLPELFVTNFKAEYNTLYHNSGDGFFYDMTHVYGLSQDSRPWVGWGCALADFDTDGWPDCFVVNGYVDNNHPDYPYGEPPLLLQNVQVGDDRFNRRFQIATREVGSYFDTTHVGRGVAFGDIDDDGDIDIVVNHKDAPPAVLTNETPREGRHWLGFDLEGSVGNRDAVGAKIIIETGQRTIIRQRKSGRSMLSSNDPRVLVGLGDIEAVQQVVIRWPSGRETVLDDVPLDTYLDVVEPEDEP